MDESDFEDAIIEAIERNGGRTPMERVLVELKVHPELAHLDNEQSRAAKVRRKMADMPVVRKAGGRRDATYELVPVSEATSDSTAIEEDILLHLIRCGGRASFSDILNPDHDVDAMGQALDSLMSSGAVTSPEDGIASLSPGMWSHSIGPKGTTSFTHSRRVKSLLDDLAVILEYHAEGGLNLGNTDLPAPMGINRSQVIETAISFTVASLKLTPPPVRPPTAREIVSQHVARSTQKTFDDTADGR